MKFELFKKPYLFHFHTRLTDGELELEDYFSFASIHNLQQVISLEHIRENPGYDPEVFAQDLNNHSKKWQIRSFLGFEAKIMPDASLNIDHSLLRKCDVIGIAEHAFPDDFVLYCEVLQKIFEKYPKNYPQVQFVWVHPGLWLRKKKRIHEETYAQLLKLASENNILIEHSLRYDLPEQFHVDKLPVDHKVVGVDAHSQKDLNKYQRLLAVPTPP